MDNRAIGVFDSGLGGLTAVKQLMRQLPNEDIIYFGDTGRVPYGTRSVDTIIKYVSGDIRFLKTFDIKMIVVACGTASAVALPVLGGDIQMPCIGVLEAACKSAVSASDNGKIGILGTPSTIASGAYDKIIKQINPNAETYSVACPLFVPLVENGHTHTQVARLVAEEYLASIIPHKVGALILGCTHYPLLKDVIYDIMDKDIALIDVGEEAARYVAEYLSDNDMFASRDGAGTYQYYVSDTADNFEKLGSVFLEQQIKGLVKKIDIEKY